MHRSFLRTGLFATALIASAISAAPSLAATSQAETRVPAVAGKRLDLAELLLTSSGLRYKELGGGLFGIVVKSNWIVCQTVPGGHASVSPHSRITLVVGRPGGC